MQPLILLTNDDGVFAEGLRALRKALEEVGEVVVIAPEGARNAVGHALTLHKPLRVRKVEEGCFAVNGTPTDCVMLGVYKLLDRKPDLVFSGVNDGPNLGDDVTYSGTVAGAMEGMLLGVPSVAVSMAEESSYFDVAAEFSAQLAECVLKNGMPEDTFLNVNVPPLPRKEIRGVRITKLGRRIYRTAIVEKTDPRGKPYYWIGGQHPTWTGGGGTDFAAVESGFISVSPLHLDLTNYDVLSQMAGWKLWPI
ncbi:MAG TPA: 5'/3'-nucleotidase SurE [Candidatus Latescibacteria bacterium]|nr:5'/3'-nucleotidase SurE [Candidatus Latescibacterota bacterium]